MVTILGSLNTVRHFGNLKPLENLKKNKLSYLYLVYLYFSLVLNIFTFFFIFLFNEKR